MSAKVSATLACKAAHRNSVLPALNLPGKSLLPSVTLLSRALRSAVGMAVCSCVLLSNPASAYTIQGPRYSSPPQQQPEKADQPVNPGAQLSPEELKIAKEQADFHKKIQFSITPNPELENKEIKNIVEAGEVPLLLYGNTQLNQFLGCINCSPRFNISIWNMKGPYGSNRGDFSMWNTHFEFGNVQSKVCPWNRFASNPPAVVDPSGRFYGFLTTNNSINNHFQNNFSATLFMDHAAIGLTPQSWFERTYEAHLRDGQATVPLAELIAIARPVAKQDRLLPASASQFPGEADPAFGQPVYEANRDIAPAFNDTAYDHSQAQANAPAEAFPAQSFSQQLPEPQQPEQLQMHPQPEQPNQTQPQPAAVPMQEEMLATQPQPAPQPLEQAEAQQQDIQLLQQQQIRQMQQMQAMQAQQPLQTHTPQQIEQHAAQQAAAQTSQDQQQQLQLQQMQQMQQLQAMQAQQELQAQQAIQAQQALQAQQAQQALQAQQAQQALQAQQAQQALQAQQAMQAQQAAQQAQNYNQPVEQYQGYGAPAQQSNVPTETVPPEESDYNGPFKFP